MEILSKRSIIIHINKIKDTRYKLEGAGFKCPPMKEYDPYAWSNKWTYMNKMKVKKFYVYIPKRDEEVL